MASLSISSVINANFISRFSGTSDGSSSGSSSQTKFSSADQVTLTIDAAARTLSQAYQNLGSTVGFLSLSEQALKQLDKVVGKVITLAETAGKSSTSSGTRQQLTTEFKKLAAEFSKITEEAQLDNFDLLSKDDLTAVLTNVGLNPDQAESIARAFDEFVVPSTSPDDIGSSEARATTPLRLPVVDGEQVAPPRRYDDVFASGRTVVTRADAVALSADAKKLRENIRANISALAEAREAVARNADFVRSSALGMLDAKKSASVLSSDSATELAEQLRKYIITNLNPRSLPQAGNLNSIVSATLLNSTE